MNGYAVKDSGQRQEFASGMVRDVTEGKTDYALIFDGPMVDRWAAHITKGAQKYEKRNWMRAEGQAEYDRFRESACRHFIQWIRGDADEDHGAAVFFNINGAEYVKARLSVQESEPFIVNEQPEYVHAEIAPFSADSQELSTTYSAPEASTVHVGQQGYVTADHLRMSR